MLRLGAGAASRTPSAAGTRSRPRRAAAEFVGTPTCLGRARPTGARLQLAASEARRGPLVQERLPMKFSNPGLSVGSMRRTRTSRRLSAPMRRGWQSAMLLVIVPDWPRPRRGWRRCGAASLTGARELAVRLLSSRAPGDGMIKKPLEQQVRPSPKRVAAARGRSQWGQKKSKNPT